MLAVILVLVVSTIRLVATNANNVFSAVARSDSVDSGAGAEYLPATRG